MKFAFLVALHEYVENAKTKGFWLGMLMLPTLIFVGVKGTVLLETKGTPSRHYVLLDQSGQFAPVIKSGKISKEQFKPAAWPAEIDTNGDLASVARALKPYLKHEKRVESDGRDVELDAAILIPRDIENEIIRPNTPSHGGGIEYWSVNLADTRLRDTIEEAVNNEIHRREYLAHGMDTGVVRRIEQTHAPFASLNPNKEEGQEKVNQADVVRQWAPSGFVYFLWVGIFAISQMLLNNIIEEKSNRIIEVLLSSVTPGELMTGKLFGIAALGLTMMCSWVAAIFAALTWESGGTKIAGQILLMLRTSNLIPMFLIYFVFGYLMYAAFILALGSVCNTIKEAQNYMALISMTMMVPLLTMTFIPKDPNGTLARVLSWIPVYTPFIMMNRVNADPPLVDLIGTAVLLVLTTAFALWMAGKIFRIGILRTGQPPRLLELVRWLKG